jgi:hypothetical protein
MLLSLAKLIHELFQIFDYHYIIINFALKQNFLKIYVNMLNPFHLY